jgi:hypothetical protein
VTTIASLWTCSVRKISRPSTASASSQTATSHMSPRGRPRSRISSITALAASSPSPARTNAIRGAASALLTSARLAGRGVSTIRKWTWLRLKGPVAALVVTSRCGRTVRASGP